jgi:16S rRNA (uracil1498-N3)-methyltransferase
LARFFCENIQSVITSGGVTLDRAGNAGEIAHITALRLRPGETFTLCDGARTDYLCRLVSAAKDAVNAEIIEVLPSKGESALEITVYLALAKGERLEYAVQKCVELGASAFVLFPSERVVARSEGKSLENRLARLGAISRSAAEQSGRGIIPKITSKSFEDAIITAARADLPLFPYEDERETTLGSVLRDANFANIHTCSIVTGAEGGFTPEEAAFAVSSGMCSVSLGARILRCDTAPIAALASLQLIIDN